MEVETKRLIYRLGEKIEHFYEIGAKVGNPEYSKAHIAKHKVTGVSHAVKIQNKRNIPDFAEFIKAVELTCNVDHPNVLSYSEVYEDQENFYLVSDLMHAELWDYFAEEKKFTELEAA